MNRKTLLMLTAVVLVGFGTNRIMAADEPDIVANYNCVGDTGGGKQYKGEVEITKEGDVYNLKWTIASKTHLGIGIRQDDKLSVSWISEGIGGIVVYKIEKGGKLSGKWSQFGTKGTVLDETLTKK
jgi:hypothetical protein